MLSQETWHPRKPAPSPSGDVGHVRGVGRGGGRIKACSPPQQTDSSLFSLFVIEAAGWGISPTAGRRRDVMLSPQNPLPLSNPLCQESDLPVCAPVLYDLRRASLPSGPQLPSLFDVLGGPLLLLLTGLNEMTHFKALVLCPMLLPQVTQFQDRNHLLSPSRLRV